MTLIFAAPSQRRRSCDVDLHDGTSLDAVGEIQTAQLDYYVILLCWNGMDVRNILNLLVCWWSPELYRYPVAVNGYTVYRVYTVYRIPHVE